MERAGGDPPAAGEKGGISMAWRRVGLACLAALAVLGASSSWAAPAEGFADFRIDAAAMDFPQRQVSVQNCPAGGDDPVSLLQWTCNLNRVTGDASFYIQPRLEGVWVTVDCFTDLNGDGVYERWEDRKAPLAPGEGSLLQPAEAPGSLEPGQSYVLEARTLVQWGEEVLEAAPSGQEQREEQKEEQKEEAQEGEPEPVPGRPLYVVGLHRGENNGPEQTYYLKIFDAVLLPEDVSPSDWYYGAVEFVLAQGYLTGTEDGLFSPDQPLNRAQLAQILWRMGGSLAAPEVSFSDVGPQDWYCAAVSWCCQEGLMSGASAEIFGAASPLTREQLAQILYQYAHRGQALPQTGLLPSSPFSDWDRVSDWAKQSADWAAEGGLLSCDSSGAFHPGGGVTRADMAVVLAQLSQLVELR